MTVTTTLTDHRLVGAGTVEQVGDRFDALRAAHRIVKVKEPGGEC